MSELCVLFVLMVTAEECKIQEDVKKGRIFKFSLRFMNAYSNVSTVLMLVISVLFEYALIFRFILRHRLLDFELCGIVVLLTA